MQQQTSIDQATGQRAAPISVLRAARFLGAFFCVASLLGILAPIAAAQELGVAGSAAVNAGQSPLNFANWPPLDLIDAKTNMTVFFRTGVPVELRIAALRRAWTADPAIREFKGLSENDWNFEDWNSIPGFGPLGPEISVPTMVAQIFGVPTRLAARSPSDELAASSSLTHTVRRFVFGTLLN